MRSLFAGCVLASAVGCAPPPVDAVQALVVVPGTITAEGAVHQDDPAFLGRSSTLSALVDLRLIGDSVVVIEDDKSRLLVLDDHLNVHQTVGRYGAGPGELEGPQDLAIWNGMYAVSDIVSQRITVFNRDGTLSHSMTVPQGPASFDIDSAGTMYVVSRSRDFYLQAIKSLGRGARRNLALRPMELHGRKDLRDGKPNALGTELVAVTKGREIHVFDNQIGLLTKFDTAGNRVLMRRLPNEYLQELREMRGAAVKEIRRPWAVVPLIKDMTVTPDGKLFLLFNAGQVFGLLVDPSDYSARALQMPASPDDAEPIRTAHSAVLGRNKVYVVNRLGYSAHLFRVQER